MTFCRTYFRKYGIRNEWVIEFIQHGTCLVGDPVTRMTRSRVPRNNNEFSRRERAAARK